MLVSRHRIGEYLPEVVHQGLDPAAVAVCREVLAESGVECVILHGSRGGVQRQLLLPACCLTEKCYRNFSTGGPLQPALTPVFHGTPARVHRPQRRPAF